MDDEGFAHRIPWRERRPPPTLGRKKGTRLGVVAAPKARVFISRLKPRTTADEIAEYVREIAGVDANVERIDSRRTNYASFLIYVDRGAAEKVLDPEEWQEGVIVRPFRGVLRRHNEDHEWPAPPANGPTAPADTAADAAVGDPAAAAHHEESRRRPTNHAEGGAQDVEIQQ